MLILGVSIASFVLTHVHAQRTPRDTKTITSAALSRTLHSPSMAGVHSLSSSDESMVSMSDAVADGAPIDATPAVRNESTSPDSDDYGTTYESIDTPTPTTFRPSQPPFALSPFITDDISAYLCMLSPAGVVVSPLARFCSTPVLREHQASVGDDTVHQFRF
eukprot:m.221122 g.221122  ORF g.221122 m.221122 type:complete len:162 (+) comp19180_c1_seq7:1490-1975(+)